MRSRYQDVYEALGDQEPTTILEAAAVLEHIREEKGFVEDEFREELDRLSEEYKKRVLRKFEKSREKEAAFTRTISEQLYSSKYRFLYEVVQNADDSSYTTAIANDTIPFLRFNVTRSHLTIETNEDGFTRANVEAICATGESSKKASAQDDHIGEKGFGFKSVFVVADHVHIQSRIWSFCFEHHEGEDGLGMVTPLQAEPVALDTDTTTKITLTLRNQADRDISKLLDAIMELPDTTLFFLKRLRTIEITTTLDDVVTTRLITRFGLPSSGNVSIQRVSQKYQSSDLVWDETVENSYKVYSREICDMPSDRRRQDRTNAEVVLAFPVSTVTAQPEMSALGQHIFAYLPLQRMPQFQFLVQSDFITSASRETVVDCEWNDAIRDGVVKVFCNAVAEFATPGHPLLFSWLDYLPTTPMEGLWKTLYQDIKNALKLMPILQTWERRTFKCPYFLQRLTPIALHNGEPILKDLPEEVYLAPEYQERHYATLKELGVEDSTWSTMVDRLQADVVRPSSDLRSRPANDKWHEKFANMFTILLKRSQQSPVAQKSAERLKRLAVIPLSGFGKWAGAPGTGPGALENIYFPSTNGVPIPNDISLHLVENIGASNARRKAFYKALGVRECPKETVLSEIEKAHRNFSAGFLNCLTHFRYLFHFHLSPESAREWIRVQTQSLHCISTHNSLYFPSSHRYHTQQLLPDRFYTEKNSIAEFLNCALIDLELSYIRPQGLSYEEWLQKVTGARYYPPLTNEGSWVKPEDKGKISDVLRAVLEHSPEEFVGVMKEHWEDYQSSLSVVRDELLDCQVPCQTGEKFPLQETYLPTVDIRNQLEYFGAADRVPLLQLPTKLNGSNYREWLFLEELGVRSKPDIWYYGSVLSALGGTDAGSREILSELYRCIARIATIQDKENVKGLFKDFPSIYYQDPNEGSIRWQDPDHCVWDAPEFLCSKSELRTLYDADPLVAAFFKDSLEIRDCNIDDILDDLAGYADAGAGCEWFDYPHAQEIYEYLNTNVQTREDWTTVRNNFKEKPLIYCGRNGGSHQWRTLSSCLWSTPFELSEYVDLSKLYPDLETFFIQGLNVRRASTSMLINELLRMTKKRSPPIDEIRQRLFDIGILIAKSPMDEPLKEALATLKEAKFLPKRAAEGTTILVDTTDDFAIPDHTRYVEAFSQKNIVLDMPIHQAQALDTVFRYLGVEGRYLSALVKEESTVGAGAQVDVGLCQDLQARAYVLYCCAAKFKSTKALRNDLALFQELSKVQVFPTDDIMTELVIHEFSTPIKVQSNRKSLHHTTLDDQLKIYVPKNHRERKACYRSQLPRLLSNILGIGLANADHAVGLILSCSLEDIDDIQIEQDIPNVDWIVKPVIELATSSQQSLVTFTPSSSGYGRQGGNWSSRSSTEYDYPPSIPVRDPQHYVTFIGHVVESARRLMDITANQSRIHDASFEDFSVVPAVDHVAVFGDRNMDTEGYNRRIGAAGEAYVFEVLSGLDLPGFSRANWQSTIRGELSDHPRYSDMSNWRGRERADIMYTDTTGALTKYLREGCTGGFPDDVLREDLSQNPIEYWLEVKTTTWICSSQFFLSNTQVQRMQEHTAENFHRTRQLYVILRVYDLGPATRMKIYVDPWRLRGQEIDFEAKEFTGKTR